MNQPATPSSFVVIGLVMLFISGCWTLAAIMPFPGKIHRSAMIASVAVSNVTFLLSVLASVFHYAGVGEEERMRKVVLGFFSVGAAALAVSILIFCLSNIVSAPPWGPVYD